MREGEPAARLTVPVGSSDHIAGKPDATLTLVEYGDYECPYCGMAYQVTKELMHTLGDRLCFVFRNFPLTQVHPHAFQAAQAAEAAGAQGRFWRYHDRLYGHQYALRDEDLLRHAELVGLDIDRFVRDLRAGTHAVRVREDFMSGVRSGVNGTPTFFINGARHEGGYDYRSLLAALVREAQSGDQTGVGWM